MNYDTEELLFILRKTEKKSPLPGAPGGSSIQRYPPKADGPV